jgi:hypothetical protein
LSHELDELMIQYKFKNSEAMKKGFLMFVSSELAIDTVGIHTSDQKKEKKDDSLL